MLKKPLLEIVNGLNDSFFNQQISKISYTEFIKKYGIFGFCSMSTFEKYMENLCYYQHVSLQKNATDTYIIDVNEKKIKNLLIDLLNCNQRYFHIEKGV